MLKLQQETEPVCGRRLEDLVHKKPAEATAVMDVD
jgi:hypothetical protein